VGEILGRPSGQLTRWRGPEVGRLGGRRIDVGEMRSMVGLADWLTLPHAMLTFRFDGRFSFSGVKIG
jgi:hypothetical protein